ncbi:MAG: hypothetical protein WCO57_11985 [Verrucomicrobiota bacterium]
MTMTRKTLIAVVLTLVPLGVTDAALTVLVSPNDIQSAQASGIIGVTPLQIFTETFNSHPTGGINGYYSTTIGVTYSTTSSKDVIKGNDQYGGYHEENYLGVTANSSVTLTLAAPAQYFGFYFTAGDPYNSIKVMSGLTTLMDFSTATLINMLPKGSGSHITAINGNQYATDDYYGQPTSNLNSSEPYAYLHFVAFGGTTFDQLILSQGSKFIFENDNHSILTATPVIPGSLVYVEGSAIPEASSWCMVLSALGGSLLVRRRH